MKTCSICHVDKPDSEFHTAPSYQCKPCKNAIRNARYAPLKAATRAKRLSTYKGEKKRCKICKRYKLTTAYAPHPTHWDRLSHQCRTCTNKVAKERYKNPEFVSRNKERGRAYYQSHKAEHKARYDKWRKENPDASKATWHRYNNRRKSQGPGFTKDQWARLISHYCPAGICLSCGKKRKLQSDHVIPLFDGGAHHIGNVQPLCASCNSTKGRWHNTDYRPDKGAYARTL